MANGNPYFMGYGNPLTRAVQGGLQGFQMGQMMGERDRQARARQLMGPAMAGDPRALQNLAQLSPEMAQQVQNQLVQQQQLRAQQQAQQAEQAEAQRKLVGAMREDINTSLSDLAKIKDVKDQQAYLRNTEQDLIARYGEQAVGQFGGPLLQRALSRDPEALEMVTRIQTQLAGEPDVKVGRFRYIETPTGFLKVDTATGDQTEVRIGSKEAETAEAERQKEAEKLLEEEQTTFDRAEKLRREYNTRSKEFFAVRDAFGRVEASVEDPDPAGDIALIFNYMKMLDPGSVVREGEFATAQNAGSVAESVYNLYNRVLQGTRLTDKQRGMFKGRAEKLFSKANEQNQKNLQQVLDLGRRYDLTRQDIFGQPAIDPGIAIELPDVQARLGEQTPAATTQPAAPGAQPVQQPTITEWGDL